MANAALMMGTRTVIAKDMSRRTAIAMPRVHDRTTHTLTTNVVQ